MINTCFQDLLQLPGMCPSVPEKLVSATTAKKKLVKNVFLMKSNFYSRSYLTNFRNYFKGRVIFVTLSPAKLQMRPRIYKKTNNNWRQKSQIELTLHLNKTRNKWHGYSEPQHQTLEQINNTHCQWGLKNALFSTEELTFRIIHVTCAPPRSHQYSHGYYEAFWGWWHVIMCKELKIYNHQKIGLNIQVLALSQVHHVHQETLKKKQIWIYKYRYYTAWY